nr:helix-turn-helix transcriptional regulator [Bradyrhizobium sp. th.b2]
MGKRSLAQVRRNLARNVRTLRHGRGWSQHDLADEAAIRQALVSAIEVGSANPTLESLDKLAAALGVDLANLFSAPVA